MKRELLRTWRSLVFSVAGLLCLAAPASATTIQLSSNSSDVSVSASLLSATLDFQMNTDMVLLSVSNGSGFDIGAVYFNAGDSVTGLVLEAKPNKWWTLETAAAATTAGGFGTFDYALIVDPTRIDRDGLLSGGTGSFDLRISGTPPWDGSEFTTNLSSGATASPSIAAAKFMTPTEVFGAFHTPEPTTALLVGMGLIGVAWQRGRRRV